MGYATKAHDLEIGADAGPHTLGIENPAQRPGFFVLGFLRGFRGLPSFKSLFCFGLAFSIRSKPSSRRLSSSDLSTN
jgi:hypothetical protein